MNNSSGQLISMLDKSSREIPLLEDIIALNESLSVEPPFLESHREDSNALFPPWWTVKGGELALKGRAGRLTRNLTSSTKKVITSFQRRLK